MTIQNFFNSWLWNLLIGTITILAYFGVNSDIVVDYMTNLKAQSVVEIILFLLAIFFFLKAIFIKKRGLDIRDQVLKDIAIKTKEPNVSLWDYGKYGKSVVQTNNTWKEWISGLIKTTEREDLDYHNYGKEFYLFDLENRKVIEIPIENHARTGKIGNTIHNGLVLRLMKKER